MKTKMLNKLATVGILSAFAISASACGKSNTFGSLPDTDSDAEVRMYAVKANGEVVDEDDSAQTVETDETPMEKTDGTSAESSETEDAASEGDAAPDAAVTEEATEDTEENNPILGRYEGTVYENSFLGFACDIKDTGLKYTPENQLNPYDAELKDWLAEQDPELFKDAFPDDTVFTLLHAVSGGDDFSSMQISVEKYNYPTARFSEKEYLENFSKDLPTYLEVMDCHDVETEIIPLTIMGEEHYACSLSFQMADVPTRLYQITFVIFKDEYVANCSVGSINSFEDTAELLNLFYPIEQQ